MLNKLYTQIFIIILLVTSISSCRRDGTFDPVAATSIAGSIGGAYLAKNIGKGNGNVLAVALGTMLGGTLGQQLGLSMDDSKLMGNTAYNTLETQKEGIASNWKNPNTGHYGSYVPVKTYKKDNLYCRDFRQTIHIDGKSHDAKGTACRQPDGSWSIVK